jgi:hypothetical protein
MMDTIDRPSKPTRPSQRDLQQAKKVTRQAEMDLAVAEGRLVIRTMTPLEREQSDARWAAAAPRRARSRRRSAR